MGVVSDTPGEIAIRSWGVADSRGETAEEATDRVVALLKYPIAPRATAHAENVEMYQRLALGLATLITEVRKKT